MNSKGSYFFLDGVRIPFSEGDSILTAAQREKYYIPHLCFHPSVSAHGSCRLCTVKLDGHWVAACTQPAKPLIQVTSNSPELDKKRLRLIQLLFAEGNHYCPSCEISGNCQLQALAYDLGMTHYHFPPLYPTRSQDGTHPDLFIDQDRCIYCGLCERTSNQLDGKDTMALSGRGSTTKLIFNSSSGKMGDTLANSHDQLAHICPVGCILNKKGNYSTAIGQRHYDHTPIHVIGNLRPEQKNHEPD